MNLQEFNDWIVHLSPLDRHFLEEHKDWKKQFNKAQKTGLISEGFAEKTMEILEGGSESET